MFRYAARGRSARAATAILVGFLLAWTAALGALPGWGGGAAADAPAGLAGIAQAQPSAHALPPAELPTSHADGVTLDADDTGERAQHPLADGPCERSDGAAGYPLSDARPGCVAVSLPERPPRA